MTLVLSWPQTVTTPWLLPGVIGGAVLLLLAALLALRARRADRRRGDWHPVGDGATPVVVGSGATALDAGTRRRADASAGRPPLPLPPRGRPLSGLPAPARSPTVAPRTGSTPAVPPPPPRPRRPT